MDYCKVCERPDPDLHHVQARSLAPDRIYDPQNLAALCRSCHSRVHSHEWELAVDGEDLVLYEKGQEIKRMPPSLTGEERDALFSRLHRGQEALESLRPLLARLSEEELVAVYNLADSISERSWQAKMHCIVDEWRRLVPLKVSTEDKVSHIHAKFGIKRAQLFNHLRVFQVFSADELNWDIPMRLYLTAARTEEPQKWLEYAVSELADNPGYSATDLEADIKIAGGDLTPLEFRVWAECPQCHFQGPMIKRRHSHAASG